MATSSIEQKVWNIVTSFASSRAKKIGNINAINIKKSVWREAGKLKMINTLFLFQINNLITVSKRMICHDFQVVDFKNPHTKGFSQIINKYSE